MQCRPYRFKSFVHDEENYDAARYDVGGLQSARGARYHKRHGDLLPRTTRPRRLHPPQSRLSGRLERLQDLPRSEHGCQDADAAQEVAVSRGVLPAIRRGTGDVVARRGEVEQAPADACVTEPVLEGCQDAIQHRVF